MKRLFCGAALAAITMASAAWAQSEVDVMKEDPFIWLEEVEGERALDWVRTQNERSVEELENYPLYDTFYQEALDIVTSDERVPSVSLRDGYAYNFWQDKDHVRGIYRRMPQKAYLDGAEEWETLLDIDKLAEEEGENWVFKGSSCLEPDYTRCLLTLSRGGSDASVIREFDLVTKSFVEDGFELPEAKSSVAWLGRDKLLVATRGPNGEVTASGYPSRVWVWERGQPFSEAEQVFEIPEDEIWAFAGSFYDGEQHQGAIFHGETFFEHNWLLLGEDGETTRMPLPKKLKMYGLSGGDFIFQVSEPWSFGGEDYKAGSVVALSQDLEEANLVIEPTDKMAIKSVYVSEDSVVANLLDDISGRVVRFTKSRRGWRERDVPLEDGGVTGVETVDPVSGEMIITYANPITPTTYYYVDKRRPKEFAQSPAFFDAEGMTFKRFEATSSDGTKIPYTVIAKEETLEGGPAPVVQYGYGGFEIPVLPSYSALQGKVWARRGGVYVLTNIRGGGEYGPAWHQAGLKGKRQIIYDDFQAISEDLIDRGITTREQIGILGGSNGGLLMGVSMTQRPELYQAVAIGVPLLDMLRYDKLLAGASWVGEYGDPDNPAERPFLETISPYHQLDQDADYPRPFIFTSTKDDRVHPGHARKFGRLLEEYEKPFLYYENIEGGHAASANLKQTARQQALLYSYFASELGLRNGSDTE
jgi:prolyl oligopeptidase